MEEVEKIRTQPSERQLKWEAFKKEQQDLVSSKSSGSKDSAAGDRKRRPKYTGVSGGFKLTEAARPPTPPPKPQPKKRPESGASSSEARKAFIKTSGC